MKKFVAVLLILMAVMMILSGCSPGLDDNERRLVHAKIRYFDGSMDTLEVDRWFASSATVTIFTAEGRKVVIGANNIILIEETEEQYEH